MGLQLELGFCLGLRLDLFRVCVCCCVNLDLVAVEEDGGGGGVGDLGFELGGRLCYHEQFDLFFFLPQLKLQLEKTAWLKSLYG